MEDYFVTWDRMGRSFLSSWWVFLFCYSEWETAFWFPLQLRCSRTYFSVVSQPLIQEIESCTPPIAVAMNSCQEGRSKKKRDVCSWNTSWLEVRSKQHLLREWMAGGWIQGKPFSSQKGLTLISFLSECDWLAERTPLNTSWDGEVIAKSHRLLFKMRPIFCFSSIRFCRLFLSPASLSDLSIVMADPQLTVLCLPLNFAFLRNTFRSPFRLFSLNKLLSHMCTRVYVWRGREGRLLLLFHCLPFKLSTSGEDWVFIWTKFPLSNYTFWRRVSRSSPEPSVGKRWVNRKS